MRTVGIRELKNKLSEYLRVVRAGEDLLVTDHGRVVAEIRPPRGRAREGRPGLEELWRSGQARVGGPNDPDAYPSLTSCAPEGTAARLLDEERGER